MDCTTTYDLQHRDTSDDVPQISMHAMLGHSSLKTLRIKRKIKSHDITILIDSRHTHNFILERIVRFLNLHISPYHQFNVMIENGERLACYKQCLYIVIF